ncbi:DUF3572 domain-containing protein [Sphingomonas sp. R86521]|uniref:DUF3572 domain-containing protein n=1 Tax=Sphingomonas sp. R86521 TaxID=3093860 RepID=UPI0036D2CE96
MRTRDSNEVANRDDAEGLALRALVWTLAEQDRAERLLAVTGLDPDDLRARAGEPAVLSEVLGFLENYEPDLIACAESLGVKPEMLVRARALIDGSGIDEAGFDA